MRRLFVLPALLLAFALAFVLKNTSLAAAGDEEKITTDTGYVVFRIGDKDAVVKGPNVAKFDPKLAKRPASVEGASVITMDAAPFIEQDRTFVPVRYLANALGVADANVKWNAATRLVTLAEPGFPTVEMTIDEKRITSNGKATATDVAPVIRSGRTMLPAKYVAEALGYTVEWDGATKTVLAYRGTKPPKEELEKVYKEFAPLKNPQAKAPATRSVPVKKVPIAAGGAYSLALKSDGTVWAWGGNGSGQLGDGTQEDRTTPLQVKNLTGVMAIAAGRLHSLALKSDGTVWAWGSNWDGQLGDGTKEDRLTPVQVKNLTGVVAIAAGYGHALALKSDGTVWAWGWITTGASRGEERLTPEQVKNLTGVVAIAAGADHSLALKSDGTVWAWGGNADGQLGDGAEVDGTGKNDRATPVKVKNLTGVVAIAAGGAHSLALKSDGTVWAWGNNFYGQLGDGMGKDRNTPVKVKNLTGVVAIAAGDDHSLALKSDGTVWAWGDNFYGQLGDGTGKDRNTPVKVKNLTGVGAIAAGYFHSLALKSDGTVWAWGLNDYGQLGDGAPENLTPPDNWDQLLDRMEKTKRLAPVQVKNLSGVGTVSAGRNHSLALMFFKTDESIQWASVRMFDVFDEKRCTLFEDRLSVLEAHSVVVDLTSADQRKTTLRSGFRLEMRS